MSKSFKRKLLIFIIVFVVAVGTIFTVGYNFIDRYKRSYTSIDGHEYELIFGSSSNYYRDDSSKNYRTTTVSFIATDENGYNYLSDNLTVALINKYISADNKKSDKCSHSQVMYDIYYSSSLHLLSDDFSCILFDYKGDICTDCYVLLSLELMEITDAGSAVTCACITHEEYIKEYRRGVFIKRY